MVIGVNPLTGSKQRFLYSVALMVWPVKLISNVLPSAAADDDGEGPALGGGQQLDYGRGSQHQSGQACAARERELHLAPVWGTVRMLGRMGAELNGTCWSYRSGQWRPGSGGAVPACAWAQLPMWKRVGLGCCFFRSATKDDLA